MITFKCCEVFERAKGWETDNEGWGPLLVIGDESQEEGIILGSKLPLINFCPWCGVKVEHTWTDIEETSE